MTGRRTVAVVVVVALTVSMASVGAVALTGTTTDRNLATVANDGPDTERVDHDGDGSNDRTELGRTTPFDAASN